MKKIIISIVLIFISISVYAKGLLYDNDASKKPATKSNGSMKYYFMLGPGVYYIFTDYPAKDSSYPSPEEFKNYYGVDPGADSTPRRNYSSSWSFGMAIEYTAAKETFITDEVRVMLDILYERSPLCYNYYDKEDKKTVEYYMRLQYATMDLVVHAYYSNYFFLGLGGYMSNRLYAEATTKDYTTGDKNHYPLTAHEPLGVFFDLGFRIPGPWSGTNALVFFRCKADIIDIINDDYVAKHLRRNSYHIFVNIPMQLWW